MAKKKNFTNNLGSTKSGKSKRRTKLSDDMIDSAFEEKQREPNPPPPESSNEPSPKVVLEEPETERLYLRVPKHLHDRLKRVSKQLGVTKSALVKQGITAELNRLESS